MRIKKIYISAFGPITDTELSFSQGLNIIEGDNESGKSAVAMFIKFMLYGLAGRSSDGVSERQQYVNWDRGVAAGWMLCDIENDEEIRIERRLGARIDGEDGKATYRETCSVINVEKNVIVSKNTAPGEILLGIPERVFMSTAFSAQSGDVRPDSNAVKESIENIVCAADENVSVKKAADILEKSRIRLRHKRGRGGEICELEDRRRKLAEEAERSKDDAQRIIRGEIALDDARRNISLASERKERLDGISEILGIFETAEKIREAETVRKELSDAEESLKSGINSEYIEELSSSAAIARKELEKYCRLKKEYSDKDAAYNDAKNRAGLGDNDGDPELDVAAARKAESRTAKTFISALGALGAALIMAIISFFDVPFAIFIGAAATLAAAGIALFIVSKLAKNSLNDILDRWNADSADELEEISAAGNSETARLGAMSDELDRLSFALDGSEREASEAVEYLRSAARSFGSEKAANASSAELINIIEAFLSRQREKIRSSETTAASLKGRLEELERQISDSDAIREAARKGLTYADCKNEVLTLSEQGMETDLGREAAALTGEEASKIAREKKFTDVRLEELRRRESELEKELAGLRAVAVRPAEAEEKLRCIDARLDKLNREYSAYMLAISSLRTAGEKVRSGIVPRITAEASEIMKKVTAGKYGSLSVTPSFDMGFTDEEFGSMEIDYLSAGTRDTAYLALRMALLRASFDNEKRPPLIFDESLCRLDSGRVKNALLTLSSEDAQVILFTCRSLEGELAADMPGVTVSKM